MKLCILFILIAGCFLGGCRSGDPGLVDLEAAMLFLEQGRNERSLRLIERAIERGLDFRQEAVAHNCAGIAHWRLGNRDLAMLAFEASVDVYPGLADPLYNMGVAAAETGDHERAIEFFERAALVDRTDTRSLEYAAYLRRLTGATTQARRTLNEALARSPHSPRIITALAVLDVDAEKIESAVAAFQRALEHDANYPPAIFNLGVINERWLNDKEQATAYFKKYLEVSPKSPKAELSRAVLKGIQQEMLLVQRKAPDVVEHPVEDVYKEHMQTGGLLERQGRHEAAVYHFLLAAREAQNNRERDLREKAEERALSAAAGNARAHYALGAYAIERGQDEKAFNHFKRASDLDEKWAFPHMALADMLVKQDKIDAALVCLKRAAEVEPDKPDTFWSLARLYDERTGLTAHAVEQYSSFIRRFPDDPRAEEARERLKALE